MPFRLMLVSRSRIAVLLAPLCSCLIAAIAAAAPRQASPGRAAGILQQFCFDCHNNEEAEARINLEKMTAAADYGTDFKSWEKVARMLRDGKMPPPDAAQPSLSQRQAVVRAIESGMDRFVREHAGDPGQVVMRRLTSAEYDYTISDLTGLNLALGDRFVSDAVSGEGFTNAGGGQFMQDSTLERYLEAAKAVASHAVIGAGPLQFFRDPGTTGRELSAIHRIKQIYRRHGFRTAAGEGAEPFGLDLYPRAMFVAWQFRYRAQLGLSEHELSQLARREGLSVRFCEHLWRVLHIDDPPFPLSIIIGKWHALAPP